jgi:hypothetical protein
MKYLVEVLVNNNPTLTGNVPFRTYEEAEGAAKKLCLDPVLGPSITAYRVIETGWGSPRPTRNSPAWTNATTGQKAPEVLFKKEATVAQYCFGKLEPLLSDEREAAWENLRVRCNDAYLSQADKNTYFKNLRAVTLELILVAVSRNSSNCSAEVRIFIDNYLERRCLDEILSLMREYNRAFGTPSPDGVALMVQLFADKVTQSRISDGTKAEFLNEFYAILTALFEEFKSIKLISSQ